jgi:multidrug transporter EmrE-like cation transporter
MKFSIVLLFAGNVLFNAAANLLMKTGMKRAGHFDLASLQGVINGLFLNGALIGGGIAYVISLGFYMFAIKNVKLSVAYPVSVSCAMALVTALSSVLLKESISIRQMIGGVVILAGIFILAG